MADLGDNNGFDNGFEKVPTAAELSASYIEEIGHALPTVSESLEPEKNVVYVSNLNMSIFSYRQFLNHWNYNTQIKTEGN